MHIVTSVGLLGDTAAILVLGVVAARTSEPHLAHASYQFMRLLIPMFGIPLTLIALATGLLLAFGPGEGGLRRFWVSAKLLLVLAVIAIGALLLAPVAFPSDPDNGAARAIVGAALDVVALLMAAWLAVFKPDRSGAGRPAARR
ncbi:MAG: hypothetical protein ACXVVQ_17505 [Solirubrobacteraceae bacterium]